MATKSTRQAKSLKPSRYPELRPIAADRQARFMQIIQSATERFRGDMPTLESALGFLFLGHYFGWKVLHIIHSKNTVRKYEEILGISVRTEFPMNGEAAMRCNGWHLYEKVSNFWKAVNGEIKVEGDKFAASPDAPKS